MVPIIIDEKNGIPIWVQLRNRIAYLIDSGFFKPGDQLPTIRALASELGINYHTCNKAYTTLESEDYIVTKRGRGTTVCERNSAEDVIAADAIIIECIRRCADLGMSIEEIGPRFQKLLEEETQRR